MLGAVGDPDANPPFPDVAAMQTSGVTFQINNDSCFGCYFVYKL